MLDLHDRETLTLDDLEGCEVRLNVPGGAHFEGTFKDGTWFVYDAGGKHPPAGTYELSFRAPGTEPWHNDAKLPTVDL